MTGLSCSQTDLDTFASATLDKPILRFFLTLLVFCLSVCDAQRQHIRPAHEINISKQAKLFFASPRQRAQEMWNWIYQLESEKFDFIEHMKHQKYEVTAK